MEKVLNTYAAHKGLPVTSFRFHIGGILVDEDDTPRTLELQDQALVDCVLIQPWTGPSTSCTPRVCMVPGYEDLRKRTLDLEQAQLKLERRTLLVMLTSSFMVPLTMLVAAAARGW